jgi:hypothetical protein
VGIKSIKLNNKAAINFQRCNVCIVCFAIVFCSFFFTKVVFADQYQLELFVDLSQIGDGNGDAVWLPPLNSPVSDNELFVAKDNGLIYLAKKDGANNQQAILDLPLNSNNSNFISLSAISLHPSFTSPEEPGYATFYTAHTTSFELGIFNNRVTLNDSNIEFAFETVITAWSYDFETQRIDPTSQREVIRIPIKTPDNAIQQLTFDPYLKPWNDDYGQLYFSLGYINELNEHALYSGVILCIYPLMFGARDYTVSASNPFIKTPEISDEIVVLGAQNIEHFFWAKYSHETIFVQHNNQTQHWLSKAKVGVNLDSQPQSNLLKQQSIQMPPMMLYQGRNFPNLRNSMVFITHLDNQLSLSSFSLESSNNELPISAAVITTDLLLPNSIFSIHQNNQNELIILDRLQSRLYSLQSTNTNIVIDDSSQPPASTSGFKPYVLAISLLIILFSALFFIKRKTGAQKLDLQPLVNEYVRFEYVLTQETILLYRINQKKAHKTLHLNDIIRCEVMLNNKVINIVDHAPENAINNQIETDIRSLFTTEQDQNMLDEHTRQIQIVLTTKEASHPICLYLRKGKSRVTSAKYFRVVDMVIDLCWVLSKRFNPNETETRIVPVAAFSRPNLSVLPTVSAESLPVSPALVKHSNTKLEDFSPTTPESTAAEPESKPQKIGHKTELVDALDKLVNLHKEGYLSDEEFSLAKANLLR